MFKRNFFPILISLFCFFCAPVFGATNIDFTEASIKYQNEYFKANLKYPVISGLEDSTFQESINNKIVVFLDTLKSDVESLAKKYHTFSKSENIKMQPYTVDSDYEVLGNNKDLVSVVITFYEYTGGAHGNHYSSSLTIDTSKNKEVLLSDLFQEGYDYKSKILSSIHSSIDLDPSSYFKNAKSSIFNIDDTTRFYMDKDHIVVYYDLYEIAPYSTGIPQFKMAVNTFGDNFLFK